MFRQSSVPTPALNQQYHISNNHVSSPASKQHRVIRKPPPPPPPKTLSSQSSRPRPPPPPPPTKRNSALSSVSAPPQDSQLLNSQPKIKRSLSPPIKNNEQSNFITEPIPIRNDDLVIGTSSLLSNSIPANNIKVSPHVDIATQPISTITNNEIKSNLSSQ